jgi:hypothetical protein
MLRGLFGRLFGRLLGRLTAIHSDLPHLPPIKGNAQHHEEQRLDELVGGLHGSRQMFKRIDSSRHRSP